MSLAIFFSLIDGLLHPESAAKLKESCETTSGGDFDMRGLFIIAFRRPPLRGSSSIQWTLTFACYLTTYGEQPIVLAAHLRVYTADFRGAKFYNNLGGDGAVLAQKIG
jgi:hypothetical protein